ncbi:unnamed protein product, partial [Gongylonema pulchrum]|uniref:Signal recognition particle receptor subunit beta n=1 Tax=Gongylonema pulchrum TaxID=637853 RepID=A0A183DSC0_9BILA
MYLNVYSPEQGVQTYTRDFRCAGTVTAIISVHNQLFLGTVRVGKSTVVKILAGKYNFTTKDYEMTQGIELHDKTFVIDGHTVDTVLVDTAGHELYYWLVRPICDPSAFFVLCFDLTNKDSFHAVEALTKELDIRKGALVGCKSDLVSRHVVSLAAAEELAAKNNLKLLLTST